MSDKTLTEIKENIELLTRTVLQQGEIINALALNCRLLEERINAIEGDAGHIPDHENIRGAEYYK